MPKPPAAHRQRLRLQARWGPARARAELALTPAGLWAVAGLVGTALVGAATVVRAARAGAGRELPPPGGARPRLGPPR